MSSKMRSAREIIQDQALKDRGEVPDPVPIELPGNHGIPEDIEDMFRRIVREEYYAVRSAVEGGEETIEDLATLQGDMEEDPLLMPYQVVDMENEGPAPTMSDLVHAARDMIENPPAEVVEPEGQNEAESVQEDTLPADKSVEPEVKQ